MSKKNSQTNAVSSPPSKPSPWKITREAAVYFALSIVAGLLCASMPIFYWIAPALGLMFLDRMSWRLGFLVFFVSTIPLFVFQTRGIIPLPDEQLYVMAAMVGLLGFIPYGLQLAVKERLPRILVPLVFPAATVTLEFVGSSGPFGTWGAIAYTQSENQTLVQVASLFGIWGISFFVSWAASTLWFACSSEVEETRTSDKPLTSNKTFARSWLKPELVAFSLATLAVITFGQARISSRMSLATPSNTSFQVACVSAPKGTKPSDAVDAWIDATQSNAEKGNQSVDATQLKLLLDQSKVSVFEQLAYLLKKSEERGTAGAKLVVWSEAALITPVDFEPEILERCRQFASSSGINLCLSLGVFQDSSVSQLFENKTVLIDATGNLVGEYLKTKLVPGEPCIPGDGAIPAFEMTGIGRVASIVCFDADFSNYVRQVSMDQNLVPNVLCVSANDWRKVDESHLQMTAFRAIENGVWVVRATSNGKSAVISPIGEIVSQGSSFGTDEPAISGWISGNSMNTLYSKIGDAFAWSSSIMLALLVIAAFVSGKKTKK